MAFNLKKHAAKADPSLPIPKQLDDKRSEFNQKAPDEGTTERQLEANVRKDKDNTVPFNTQLEAGRAGTNTGITEAALNNAPKLYNDKRDDTTHTKKVTAVNLVSEAYFQERLKAFKDAQRGSSRDTEFWDKEVGVQMEGPKTKIVSNDQKTQLQNHPDRFKGLKPDLSTQKDFDEMITAADRMQFVIFAKAASEGRKLTKSELQQITDINSGKARAILAYESRMEKLAKRQSLDMGMYDDIANPKAANPLDEAIYNEETGIAGGDGDSGRSNVFDPLGNEDDDYFYPPHNSTVEDIGRQSGLDGMGSPTATDHYSIVPDADGYTVYSDGQRMQAFPTEQQAIDWASQNLPGKTLDKDGGLNDVHPHMFDGIAGLPPSPEDAALPSDEQVDAYDEGDASRSQFDRAVGRAELGF